MNKEQAFHQLNKFIGNWNTEGVISSSNNGPEIKITGVDNYEWILDGCFLLHQADVIIGTDHSKTHEVIGYDRLKHQYTMQHYNNEGNSGMMTATVHQGIWTFSGDSLRFNGGFKENDDVFTGIWEQLSTDKIWTHLMDIKLSKSTV